MKNNKGITFIELVIAMVLFGIIITPIFMFLQSGYSSWARGTEHIDVVQNMRFAMDRIVMDIRQGINFEFAMPTKEKNAYQQIKFHVPNWEGTNKRFSEELMEITYHFDVMDQELEKKERKLSGVAPFQPMASKIKVVEFSIIESEDGDWQPGISIKLIGVRQDGYEIMMNSKVVPRALVR